MFTSQDVKNHTDNFSVPNDAVNTSDHLPIGFHLNVVGVNGNLSGAKRNVVMLFVSLDGTIVI